MRHFVVLACAAAAMCAGLANGAAPRATDPIQQTDPAIAFGDADYLVLWDEFDPNLKTVGTFGARVHDGTVLDPDELPIVGDERVGPRVAFDGTNYLVVWADRRAG